MLALPLLFVAVVAITLAWAQTGPPTYAAESTGLALDQELSVDQAQVPDVGSTTLLQHEAVITTSTGNGDITGTYPHAVTTTDAQGSGVFDFSAIPRAAQDISSGLWVMTAIGAILLSATTIAGFYEVRSRRQRRRVEIPIASTSTINGTPTDTPTDMKKRFRTMGRTALNSVFGILSVLRTAAATSQAKAKTTTATA